MQTTGADRGVDTGRIENSLPRWSDARQLLPLFGRAAFAVEDPTCEGEPRTVDGIAVVAYGIHADPAVRERRVLRGLARAILPSATSAERVESLVERFLRCRR